jgi:hypothetical protein
MGSPGTNFEEEEEEVLLRGSLPTTTAAMTQRRRAGSSGMATTTASATGEDGRPRVLGERSVATTVTATSAEDGGYLLGRTGGTAQMAGDTSAVAGRAAPEGRAAAASGEFVSASAVTGPLAGIPRQGSGPLWGPRYTRPFSPWEEVRQRVPSHLEVQRFNRLPSERRALSKNRRRVHAPCDIPIPREWNLDVLYFRFPEEEDTAGA